MKSVDAEGMPIYKFPYDKGHLLIKFTVKFPADGEITPEALAKLEEILPARQEVIIPDDAEECSMSRFDATEHARSRRHRQAYMEDDDEGHQGPNVQCASH